RQVYQGDAEAWHAVYRSSGALWPSSHDLRSRSVFLAANEAKRVGTVVEHVPAKCTLFADKNMLQHIDPGALSHRRNGSILTESALAKLIVDPQPATAAPNKRPIREPEPTWNFDADSQPNLADCLSPGSELDCS